MSHSSVCFLDQNYKAIVPGSRFQAGGQKGHDLVDHRTRGIFVEFLFCSTKEGSAAFGFERRSGRTKATRSKSRPISGTIPGPSSAKSFHGSPWDGNMPLTRDAGKMALLERLPSREKSGQDATHIECWRRVCLITRIAGSNSFPLTGKRIVSILSLKKMPISTTPRPIGLS